VKIYKQFSGVFLCIDIKLLRIICEKWQNKSTFLSSELALKKLIKGVRMIGDLLLRHNKINGIFKFLI
jgi:hypothetical protein